MFAAAAGVAAAWLWSGPAPAPSADELRAGLLGAAGTSAAQWQQGPSVAHGKVRGDVVWNPERQEGYLRIAGLEPLDARHQYQLWVVDGERAGEPVDGGLFDVRAAREQIVPVQARLPVGNASAFVITVEERGGVVVSAQQTGVAIASL